MRYSAPNVIAVGLLSALVFQTSGNPVTRAIACAGENCNEPAAISWASSRVADYRHPKILPRAGGGGGGGGGKPDKPGPDGTPGVPNDPSNPSTPGNQNGEDGGFEGQPESGGGFTDLCEKKRSWLTFWRRASCGPTNPQQRPSRDVIRTNNNQPATGGTRLDPPRPLDVQQRKATFDAAIIANNLQSKPWFFYSGFNFDDIEKWKVPVDKKVNEKTGQKPAFMRDLVDTEKSPGDRTEYSVYRDAGIDWYYWAVNSKAFAQAVRGDIFVIIPADRAVNQPYDGQGSNWWSFELPELTRNPNVNSITVIHGDDRINMDTDPDAKQTYEITGPLETIWRRNDPPMGTPGDEHYQYTRPQWPFEP
ncbi:hypothetical protein FB567DRAFT_533066 [Paraphoma chrysanthemicola]|uniref:Uncharacterized protein n=1 Tax=Paraphoma chrysanthemicola TaxID=798071 RepID=A0A8K0R1R8_9PLEO|nr:hypothetical protein FB567DRAFT_533066 [Paraphoma chrysanthemicola]